MNTCTHSPAIPTRTHCRICEAPLKTDDDPVWGLCETCLTMKRDDWRSVFSIDEPPKGMIPRPNREA